MGCIFNALLKINACFAGPYATTRLIYIRASVEWMTSIATHTELVLREKEGLSEG